MNEYVFSADLLNKFHTALPWVQALMVISACIAIVAMAYFFKQSVTEVMKPFIKHDSNQPEKEEKPEWKDKYYRGE